MIRSSDPPPHPLPGARRSLAGYVGRHFQFEASEAVATITLNRPERKNPLTFESYAELRDLFRDHGRGGVTSRPSC